MTAPAKPTASIVLPDAYALPALIVLLTLLNGFYNSMATAFGYGFPFDTFCFSPGDLLADFIKSALSYPGPAIAGLDGWPALYRDYLQLNPYGGAAALAEGKLTNLHGMPLPTFILLEARRAFAFYNPNFVTFVFFGAVLAPFCALILAECRKSSSGLIAVLSFLLSYPLIFAITRGNLTAIMLGEVLIAAILLTWRGQHLWLVALLLALAINLRPNAAIFLALPLLRWPFRHTVAWAAASLAMAAAVFFGALALAQPLYPDYTLNNFSQAVLVYRTVYAAGDAGLAYGSSLLGGLKFIYSAMLRLPPPAHALELASILLGIVSILLWLAVVLRGRIARITSLFTLLAIYALFSGVFGDYHLIVYFAVVLIYARENQNPFAEKKLPGVLIASAAVLVLAPKNYVFWHGFSAQIFLNPLILIISALAGSAAALSARDISSGPEVIDGARRRHAEDSLQF